MSFNTSCNACTQLMLTADLCHLQLAICLMSREGTAVKAGSHATVCSQHGTACSRDRYTQHSKSKPLHISIIWKCLVRSPRLQGSIARLASLMVIYTKGLISIREHCLLLFLAHKIQGPNEYLPFTSSCTNSFACYIFLGIPTLSLVRLVCPKVQSTC